MKQSRRQFLSTWQRVLAGLGGWELGRRLLPGTAWAQETPQRLVLVFLDGGWNSHFAVDPIVGDRRGTGNFEAVFDSHDIQSPTGKANLLTGIGLQAALPAFQNVPTAFVNGLFVDIPAHDTAATLILTGKAAVGRDNNDAAFPALVAAATGGFASHVVFGGGLPLGDTIGTAPPLVTDGEALGGLLEPPGNDYSPESRAAIEQALVDLDDMFHTRLGDKARDSLKPFRASQSEIAAVFSRFGDNLKLTDELRDRYRVSQEWTGARFAATYLAFKEGLTRIATIRTGGYDTHTNELGRQLPQQQAMAANLNTLVEDLRNTPDPSGNGASLMDTTTIVVASEFVRTPRFNGGQGTDHQNSSSAIVMGRGVKDNVVIGGTDAEGKALGWDGQAQPMTDESRVDGSHLAATILRLFGQDAEADAINPSSLEGLLA